MKRCGFVANSSSSSFAVIGERVSLKDVDLEKGTYYAIGCAEFEEGKDVFQIDETLLKFMRLVWDEFTIIRALWVGYDGGSKVDADLTGATYVWAGTMSHYHSDKETFWDYYQADPEKAKLEFKNGNLTLDELIGMLKSERCL